MIVTAGMDVGSSSVKTAAIVDGKPIALRTIASAAASFATSSKNRTKQSSPTPAGSAATSSTSPRPAKELSSPTTSPPRCVPGQQWRTAHDGTDHARRCWAIRVRAKREREVAQQTIAASS
ncbi:MAG TPA: hypothetical protein VHX14_07145 [Thermoanaerobaculia bacterium]|jgi:hypothetical protein|nr:hypothetical protein [Thermoanaerobaculia bacterium]